MKNLKEIKIFSGKQYGHVSAIDWLVVICGVEFDRVQSGSQGVTPRIYHGTRHMIGTRSALPRTSHVTPLEL
jgi:hypothetical protein